MAGATTLVLWSVGIKGRHTSRNRQRAIESAAVPRTDRFARSSSCSCPPSVQYTGTIHCHHSHDRPPACRIRESSYSEIYCQAREYRCGGDGWDSLLGLVGCHGLVTRCAPHRIHQAGRGFASVLMPLVQHAGADAASDSTLGALRRDGFGTGDPLPAPPSGKSSCRALTPGETGGPTIVELVG